MKGLSEGLGLWLVDRTTEAGRLVVEACVLILSTNETTMGFPHHRSETKFECDPGHGASFRGL